MPTAKINGMEMQYQDEGDGFPVLFGHSYLWDSRMWSPQLDVLKEQFSLHCSRFVGARRLPV